MALIAERGLKGASLRELARRVELTQPSLYHYFQSKDDLVRQIIANYSATAMDSASIPASVDSFRQLLRVALVFIADLYLTERHVVWVRFLFAVTMERAEFGGLLREIFIERGMDLAMLLGGGCIERGEVRAEDLRPALELAAGAVTMRLLEERVLNTGADATGKLSNEGGGPEALAQAHQATLAFIDFVVDAVVLGVERRRNPKTEEDS